MVIDTNIALRYLLRDNDEGFKFASAVFESPDPVTVTDLIIFEMVYVMQGDSYKKDREQVAGSIKIMLKNNSVTNPSDLADRYLRLYAETNLDLVDCYLIVYSVTNKEELVTLDKKMRKIYEKEKQKHQQSSASQ